MTDTKPTLIQCSTNGCEAKVGEQKAQVLQIDLYEKQLGHFPSPEELRVKSMCGACAAVARKEGLRTYSLLGSISLIETIAKRRKHFAEMRKFIPTTKRGAARKPAPVS